MFKLIFTIITYFFIIILLTLITFIIVCYIRACLLIKKNSIKNIYIKKESIPTFCHYKDFPPLFEKFLVSVEDKNFFKHKGYDIKAMIRATIKNIKRKKLVMSGSTITQQLAKNLYLDSNKTFYRKFTEIFISRNIEKLLSKIQILELYINVIYFGAGQYGVQNASKYYFDKNFKDLTVNQSFILITIISSPNNLNPCTKKEQFIKSRNQKIKRIHFDKSEEKYYENIISHDINNLDSELRK